MPRPRAQCRCRRFDGDRVFKPRSIPMSELDTLELELAELEALRLCDREGLHQEQAAQCMGISRGTVQRLLDRARRKVATALTESVALVIREESEHETVRSHPRR